MTTLAKSWNQMDRFDSSSKTDNFLFACFIDYCIRKSTYT